MTEREFLLLFMIIILFIIIIIKNNCPRPKLAVIFIKTSNIG